MKFAARCAQPRWFVAACLLGSASLTAPLRAVPAATKPVPAAPVKPALPARPVSEAEARKAAARAAAKAVSVAVAALFKEYQAYAGGGGKVELRAASDYFAKDKPAELTDEAVVSALASQIAPDAGADSYIKWQLLSGLAAEVDAKLAPQMLLAYSGAGDPFPRPGMSAEDKKELDAAVLNLRHPEAATINAVNDKFKTLLAAWEKRNAPVVGYRDAIRAKLPASYELLRASLKDGYERAKAGIGSEPMGIKLAKDIRTWDNGAQPLEQTKGMAEALLHIINQWGGVPAEPKAQAPVNPGDSARAPVLLAGGFGNNGGNYGGRYGNPNGGAGPNGAGPVVTDTYPPKYYDHVEIDVKADKLVWVSESAKFIRKDDLVKLWRYLQAEIDAPPMVGK